MRKSTLDAKLNPIPKDTEDKRPLVLFLFGLLLLLADILPNPLRDDNAFSTYTFLVETDQSWRVTRTREASIKTEPGQKVQELFALTWALPLPAELSLFINQPMPINIANAETLQMLPGIGPKLAQAIVRTREKSGPFQRPEDLLAVPRIGPKRLAILQPLISCGPEND